jgi:hypothetical protein
LPGGQNLTLGILIEYYFCVTKILPIMNYLSSIANQKLSKFKEVLKKKKFESNLLKATKLFGDDIAKSSDKKKTKVKKAAKKRIPKKAADTVHS